MKDFSIFLILILTLFAGVFALGFSIYTVFLGLILWSVVLFVAALLASVVSLHGLSKIL